MCFWCCNINFLSITKTKKIVLIIDRLSQKWNIFEVNKWIQ